MLEARQIYGGPLTIAAMLRYAPHAMSKKSKKTKSNKKTAQSAKKSKPEQTSAAPGSTARQKLLVILGFVILIGGALVVAAALVITSLLEGGQAPTPVTDSPALIAAPLIESQPTATVNAPLAVEDTQTAATEEQPTAIPLVPDIQPTPDGAFRQGKVPILMYHYISESPDPDDTIRLDLSVPPDMFEQQMAWLDDNGWTTITFYDFVEWLAEGVELPEKPIILTFDDGYRDNYENAFPVLEKYGQVGTFFVLTAPPEQGHPVYMSWDMLSEMSQAGQSIEMHAHDHFDLSGRDAAFLNVQIVESASIMEQRLGYRPRFLAYPGGTYDEGTIQALKDTDYWLAVTTQFGWLHSSGQEYELKRVRIHGDYSLAQFSGLLGGVFDE